MASPPGTAVRILDKDAGDCPQFVPLVKETRRHFEIGEVSADKAYASLENFEAVAECGREGFIAFKSNATGGVGGLFEKAFPFFQFKRDEFLAHYHKRSNVESTISMSCKAVRVRAMQSISRTRPPWGRA
jgi:hypothetical protein